MTESVTRADDDAAVDPGYGDQWYVSHWNARNPFDAGALTRAVIHDTTLRDGEQHVGVAFSPDDKVAIGDRLSRIGVQRIEVCMPASGPGDQDAARRLAELNTDAEIWTLARSVRSDVELCASLGSAGAGLACLANDQYLHIFGWTLSHVLDLVGSAVERAKELGLDTAVFIADASRMSKRRLEEIITGVDARSAPGSYAMMDTFGALEPSGTRELVRFARSLTAGGIEFHGHNDFGLSVANSIAASAAGASAIHTAVHGLGERIGNTPLEEYVVAAKVLYDADIPFDTSQIMDLSRLVAAASGSEPSSNKPIVGAFNEIESGLVSTEYSRLVLEGGRPNQWLLPFTPDYVGKGPVEIIAGKASGVTNVRHGLSGTDYETLDDEQLRRVLEKVHAQAVITKAPVPRHDLLRFAAEVVGAHLTGPVHRATDY
ncbi:hypothetical protein CH298_26650 [Rhodococcoides fascians]|uniref:hypothetical protein n=1 Tax=Rhodococcoides fascians TaxID=1828 RepID=UPI000B9BD524|nr:MULTISPECIES: hypothetical protein [Rhodococcus]OZD68964.1 hypothetical protein CH263_08765 [Rhodococcus sp. 06-1059B-a]OZE81354.1 hypothetical protein CH303_27190 [Rhodococcus fascians]OZF10178.1 hypothetical protein CH298_26650 [Rhodococcus fascians]OZF13269.1 hypothetical protein CH297_26945 [Rhodococcus fascians]OZF59366.1 hypothetical protein CH308_27390 [Rhodococcus fascians]